MRLAPSPSKWLLRVAIAIAFIAVVSLLVFFNEGAEAYPVGDEDCGLNLTVEALKQCMREKIYQHSRSLLSLHQEDVYASKGPAWADEPQVPRSYGYFIGDLTELSFVFEFKPGVEADLSRLPGIGVRVGEYVVRDRTVTEVTLGDGTRQVTVWYLVQNYAVLCQQSYVPFGPLEVFWRQGTATEWQRLEVSAAMILVSPMSLCDEVPDIRLAPRDMLEFSRANVAWTLSGLGMLVILGALAIFVKGLREMFRRFETSPLWQARKAISHVDASVTDAIGVCRTALREKFHIAGSDTSDEVREKFAALAFWRAFADEAAALWEETTLVLYEEQTPDSTLVERIRSFINRLSRREVDES